MYIAFMDTLKLNKCYVWESNDLICRILSIYDNGMVDVETEECEIHHIDEGNLRGLKTSYEQNHDYVRLHLDND